MEDGTIETCSVNGTRCRGQGTLTVGRSFSLHRSRELLTGDGALGGSDSLGPQSGTSHRGGESGSENAGSHCDGFVCEAAKRAEKGMQEDGRERQSLR